jgi:uncharacterized phosphosugar-binding protein
MDPLPAAFQKHIESLLGSVGRANSAAIAAAGAAIGRSVAEGGVLHTFGSGHSEILSRELIGRSGGLICVSGIFDPGAGVAENVIGYGARLVERYDRRHGMRAGEAIVVISNSGKNVSPIEVALHAKEKGLTVIGLCSLAMSRTAPTLHPGGRRLHEIADHVLDNGGVPGDASIEIAPGVLAGPTSTLTGALLLNQLQLAAIGWLRANGHEPPVFLSQNLPGGEAHNDRFLERYRGRIARNF